MTRAAPANSNICRLSTLDRSDPSKLPWWAQEAPGTKQLQFTSTALNNFEAGSGKNSFGFSFDGGQVQLWSTFDKSVERVHHHHLYEVNFLMIKFDGPATVATRYFYLNDDSACMGQEAGVVPSNIDRVLSVSMLTLNEY